MNAWRLPRNDCCKSDTFAKPLRLVAVFCPLHGRLGLAVLGLFWESPPFFGLTKLIVLGSQAPSPVHADAQVPKDGASFACHAAAPFYGVTKFPSLSKGPDAASCKPRRLERIGPAGSMHRVLERTGGRLPTAFKPASQPMTLAARGRSAPLGAPVADGRLWPAIRISGEYQWLQQHPGAASSQGGPHQGSRPRCGRPAHETVAC